MPANPSLSCDIFDPHLPQSAGKPFYWNNLEGASLSLTIASAIAKSEHPLLIIAPDSLAVSRLMEELQFFIPTLENLIDFPDWETLPYDHFSPHQDIISDRLKALYHLPMMKKGVMITTASTLMHKLPPRAYIDQESFVLSVGERLNIDLLRSRLAQAGYQAVSQVREHGEFAIRGSIIDLFPMGSATPFRIDLLDDEVDTIRIFSTETQRSLEKIDRIQLLPAKEFPLTSKAIDHFREAWRAQFSGNPLHSPLYQDVSDEIASPGIEYYLPLFFDSLATLFDYLPDNTLIVTIEDIENQAQLFWKNIENRYEQMRFNISRPLLPPHQIFISPKEILENINHHAHLIINHPHHSGDHFPTLSSPILDIDHQSPEPFALLKSFLDVNKNRILFCAETLGRREVMLQFLKTLSIKPIFFESWQSFLSSHETYGIAIAPLDTGFILEKPTITLVAEGQLYGGRIMQRRLRKKTPQDTDALIRNLTELQVNDPIVHIDHGVGRYLGLQTLQVGGELAEFLCLEYLNNDKLYVPITSLHLISRYSGANSDNVPFSKLGTDQWKKAKRRAAEKARDVAAELLDLYARRASRPGHRYELPIEQYNTFCASFPFEETPDQLQAIEHVFTDMASDKPMDRVICGDVGFGKTEVALRAAFLAIQNNKQVAMLVPTTLLAQQHFKYFQDRFADWPVQVDMLSRFRTNKEQKAVLERMEKGQIDIVIGTHKLLQKDIQFKSLGLVILDEEHRFGVKQKEKLKALRSSVDILTMTATPIPRTLNMAFSGIRDLSLITTPPARRLSVKTFVHEYQDAILEEAIRREIIRGGQVYFLHNDIDTIQKKAEDIAKLVPEARTGFAHGQLDERELERVMSAFYHRHFNVLVCSTIIESGIDIPTANTIIINRADKLGLAQLHQLRGRVGRSHHQAYAYLLVPPREQLSQEAIKRLDAIATLGDLGMGFTLATHDLEIRGAGEFLGEKQSGDMQEIGFTLYMDLLSRSVEALKSGKEPDLEKSLFEHRSEIDLHITSLIPDAYLGDIQLRLQFYKRIANAKNQTELDDIQVEMIDRFGLLPIELKNLFAITELKFKADQLGIIKIEANDKGGKFEFNETPQINPENIIRLIQAKSQQFKLEGPHRLRFTLPSHDKKDRIMLINNIIDQLV